METGLKLSVWLVLTPNVLLLDYAGPAEALRIPVHPKPIFQPHSMWA